MKKDRSIQVVRILAMFSIILCHLLQEMSSSILIKSAQFFNVGVYIFIFISGLLYGKKDIGNSKTWLKKRFTTIMIPIYVFIIILSYILLIKDNFDYKYIFIYLFDVQYFFGSLLGSGHLWFVTIIMICYLVTLLINKYKTFLSKKHFIFIILLVILSILLSMFNLKYGLILWYITIYVIGYVFIDNKKYGIVLPLIGFLIAIIVRLLGQKYVDSMVFYDGLIVPMSQIVIAISIYLIIIYIYGKLEKTISKFASIINYLDTMSYYIYISHYIFFIGPIRSIALTSNILINIIITLLLSYIFAIILKYIVKFVNKIVI